MDVTPALPPWGRVSADTAICIAHSSERYQVPELLVHSILSKEGGTSGQCVTNKNKTVDCGLAQINSSWTDYFKKYGVSMHEIKHDSCVNIQVASYILKKHYLNKDQDWYKAIMAYHLGPANWTQERMNRGFRYANDVVVTWKKLEDYATKYKSIIEQKYQQKQFNKSQ